MQDIDADIDDAGGNLDGAVLHALDICDELVEVVDDGLRLGPCEVGEGGDDRQVRVDDVLQLIQNQVDRGRNRCDKNKAWLVGAISRLVKGYTRCLVKCLSFVRSQAQLPSTFNYRVSVFLNFVFHYDVINQLQLSLAIVCNFLAFQCLFR